MLKINTLPTFCKSIICVYSVFQYLIDGLGGGNIIFFFLTMGDYLSYMQVKGNMAEF